MATLAIETNLTQNVTSASRAVEKYGGPRTVSSITIHWWDDPAKKPTLNKVVAGLRDESSERSAHYVVEGGRIVLLVPESDIAWHAGSHEGNRTSIGIECSPYATDGDYATVAALVADIRARHGDLPLAPHKRWFNTACPGVWDLVRLDALARGKSVAPARSIVTTSAREVTVDGQRVIQVPRSWSNNDRSDYMDPVAYASFTRMIGAAVAATGGTWGINDAKRPRDRQIQLWNANYERWKPGVAYVRTKRWDGVLYGRRSGTVEVAVPGTTDHGPGKAVDITGGSVQNWLHANGSAYGWVFDVPGEWWHMAFKVRDRYAGQPAIDWAFVQSIVGVTPDEKVGPMTISAVKSWQGRNGLTPDGLVGPATLTAMTRAAGIAPSTPLSASGTAGKTIDSGDFLMALTPEAQIKLAQDAAEGVRIGNVNYDLLQKTLASVNEAIRIGNVNYVLLEQIWARVNGVMPDVRHKNGVPATVLNTKDLEEVKGTLEKILAGVA